MLCLLPVEDTNTPHFLWLFSLVIARVPETCFPAPYKTPPCSPFLHKLAKERRFAYVLVSTFAPVRVTVFLTENQRLSMSVVVGKWYPTLLSSAARQLLA